MRQNHRLQAGGCPVSARNNTDMTSVVLMTGLRRCDWGEIKRSTDGIVGGIGLNRRRLR